MTTKLFRNHENYSNEQVIYHIKFRRDWKNAWLRGTLRGGVYMLRMQSGDQSIEIRPWRQIYDNLLLFPSGRRMNRWTFCECLPKLTPLQVEYKRLWPWRYAIHNAISWHCTCFCICMCTFLSFLCSLYFYLQNADRGLITLRSGCSKEHGLCDQGIGKGSQLYGAWEDHGGWNIVKTPWQKVKIYPWNNRWWTSLRRLSKTLTCTQALWKVLWLGQLLPPLQPARFVTNRK